MSSKTEELTQTQLAQLRIIKKPWGWETVVCSSNQLQISYLQLRKNQTTSLHCHPNKRTGYIVIRGPVEVEFLAGVKRYSRGDRVNFRPALFHRTKALDEGAILLELESPPDKCDLIRLEDFSGRTTSIYESEEEAVSQRDLNVVREIIERIANKNSELMPLIGSDFDLCTQSLKPNELLRKYDDDVILSPITRSINSKKTENLKLAATIIGVGDVTSVGDLRRMSPVLELNDVIELLLLKFK